VAASTLQARHRTLLSDPASVRESDRVREPAGRRGLRAGQAGARRGRSVRPRARTHRAPAPRQRSGRFADVAGAQAPRTRACARHWPAGAAARRDCRRPHRGRDRRSRRHHPRDQRGRHDDRVDRACRCRVARRRHTPDRPEFRPQDRGGRTESGDGIERGARDLHGDRSLMSLLETRALPAPDRDLRALFGVNTRLEQGDTLAIIGANGAGKSTYLRAITGLLRGAPWSIVFDGEPIGHLSAAEIMKRGIALVPEGRRLFPSLTVEENLQVGTYGRAGDGHWNIASIYSLFPKLR